MMFSTKLRGSADYVWALDDILGHGSMGRVYVGRHRRMGDKYAVKVFNDELKMMQKDYIKTELEILKEIPAHRNIVNLVDIQVQKHTANDKVVIMELCEGGSLQEMLDKPEHYYGLREEEFVLVFFHIGDAIEFLHQHRIIHRDIKPGNILLCISSDNSHIYKLTDFGTSNRYDPEEGSLRSLTGTEEYMHPDLHQAFFIDRKNQACYDFTVDLWSFGVTLYQCATGMFPFIPWGGIKYDRYVLQTLVRNKEPGVISQKQAPDGTIVSSKQLPDHCYLTSGTKKKAEELLAVAFDLKARNKERAFFKEFHKFKAQMKIYLSDVMKATDYTLYLDGGALLSELKEAIFSWTQAPVDNQLLFWDMTLLCDTNVETEPISHWLKTTAEKPLMLVADPMRDPGLVKSCSEQDLWDLPENGQNDGKWAKETCGMIYHMQYLVKQNVLSQQHMIDTQILLRNAIDCKLKLIRAESRSSIEILDLLELLGERFIGSQKPNVDMIRKGLQELDILNMKIQPVFSVCQESRCLDKAEKVTQDAEALYSSIKRFSNGVQCHNDAEMQKYNKSELRRRHRLIKNLLRHHCSKETRYLCHKLAKPSEYSILLPSFMHQKLSEIKRRIKELMQSVMAGHLEQLSSCSKGALLVNGAVQIHEDERCLLMNGKVVDEPSEVISRLIKEVEMAMSIVEANTETISQLQ